MAVPLLPHLGRLSLRAAAVGTASCKLGYVTVRTAEGERRKVFREGALLSEYLDHLSPLYDNAKADGRIEANNIIDLTRFVITTAEGEMRCAIYFKLHGGEYHNRNFEMSPKNMKMVESHGFQWMWWKHFMLASKCKPCAHAPDETTFALFLFHSLQTSAAEIVDNVANCNVLAIGYDWPKVALADLSSILGKLKIRGLKLDITCASDAKKLLYDPRDPTGKDGADLRHPTVAYDSLFDLIMFDKSTYQYVVGVNDIPDEDLWKDLSRRCGPAGSVLLKEPRAFLEEP